MASIVGMLRRIREDVFSVEQLDMIAREAVDSKVRKLARSKAVNESLKDGYIGLLVDEEEPVSYGL